jgi:hypothetical protein
MAASVNRAAVFFYDVFLKNGNSAESFPARKEAESDILQYISD